MLRLHGRERRALIEIIQRIQSDDLDLGLDDSIEIIMHVLENEDQINGEDPYASSPYLLEQLLTILQRSYGRNAISGETLEALRRHALTKEELNAISAGLKETYHCTNCGTRFERGSTATVRFNNEDRNGEMYLLCDVCDPGRLTRCREAGCLKQAEIPGRYRGKLKFRCAAHERAARGGAPLEPAAPETEPPDPDLLGAHVEAFQQAILGRVRRNAGTLIRDDGPQPAMPRVPTQWTVRAGREGGEE